MLLDGAAVAPLEPVYLVLSVSLFSTLEEVIVVGVDILQHRTSIGLGLFRYQCVSK